MKLVLPSLKRNYNENMEAKNMKINNECCCGCKTEKPDQIKIGRAPELQSHQLSRMPSSA